MKFLHRMAEHTSFRRGRAAALLLAAAFFLHSCAIFCPAETAGTGATEAFSVRFYEEEEKKITFLAAGDNLIHSSIYKEACVNGAYNFTPIYEAIAPTIAAADIAFVNQETPLGDSGFSGYPRFCSPYAAGDALIAAGFDVIGLANNHMLDRGAAGLIRTREYLAARAECVVGGDADGYRIVERQGIRVAFLAYTYATNCGGEIAVPQISEALLRRQVSAARAAADLVFVSMHWGVEYDIGAYTPTFYPTVQQEELADLLTALGADVVIGTHPHVLETAEWKERADGHRTLVVYSLGNLVSNMRFDKTLLGGLLSLDIRQKKNYTYIEGAEIYPIVCHYPASSDSHRVYFLKDYTDALASEHGTRRQANAKPFCRETLIAYYEANVPPDFRPETYK